MAETRFVTASDLPVKRPRDDKEKETNNNNNGNVLMEIYSKKQLDCISSVIPSWFSKISQCGPVCFSFFFLLYRPHVHVF
ncbi:hypothetical protein CICLE_v10023140mg [Citrus x clementina]|uniref:Uncharacterized protein n=2 Tax=Citrus TaxID=2706 RepID=A0A067DTZ3_CITSI|nr:hypothetical protein CICLE_v10023140mg [Citrus x clementina]KDO46283.1 hypothetical protein CISIN_1g043095mg [Citrus sinensis]